MSQLETNVPPGAAHPAAGLFFEEHTAASLIEAVDRFERQPCRFGAAACGSNAERFAVPVFQSGIRAFIDDGLSEFRR